MIVFGESRSNAFAPYGEMYVAGKYRADTEQLLRELNAHLEKQGEELRLKEVMTTLTLSVASSNYASTDEIAEASLGAGPRQSSNSVTSAYIANQGADRSDVSYVETALTGSVTDDPTRGNVCVHVHPRFNNNRELFAAVLAARLSQPTFRIHVHVVICTAIPYFYSILDLNNPSIVPHLVFRSAYDTKTDKGVDYRVTDALKPDGLQVALTGAFRKQAKQSGFFRAVAQTITADAIIDAVPDRAKFPGV